MYINMYFNIHITSMIYVVRSNMANVDCISLEHGYRVL